MPRAAKDGWTAALVAAGVTRAGVWAYEAHRAAAARPRLGVDTDERTIPHEVGWIGGPGVGAVHLDKGCYRGQETVARVHNLGKPPRMLVLVHLDGSADRPATGDPLLAGGRAVGRLGSVVDHVDDGPIALALVKRALPGRHRTDHRRRDGGGRRDRRGLGPGRRRRRRRAARGGATAQRRRVEPRQARAYQRPAAGHGKVLAGQ